MIYMLIIAFQMVTGEYRAAFDFETFADKPACEAKGMERLEKVPKQIVQAQVVCIELRK